MPRVETPLGPIEALPAVEYHPDGRLRSCIAAEPCVLHAACGDLVPQHLSRDLRKRRLPAISFFDNGMPRTVPLQEQTTVDTPLGPLPAEQVTFHENGALHRVFPLNGCLSGHWTQEDEARLASPLTIDTPSGRLTATCIALRFSPAGALLGLTLWPGEEIDVPCPCGVLPVRMGVAYREDGTVRSVEPARPVPVPTPLGEILAFDPDAVGVSGDVNSLGFAGDGTVERLSTVSNVFALPRPGGVLRVRPPMRVNPCDGETREPAPLRVRLRAGSVTFTADSMEPVTARAADVTATRVTRALPTMAAACGLNASFM